MTENPSRRHGNCHFPAGWNVAEGEPLRRERSVCEAEMQDVAVGDDVVLALEAELARFASPRLAAIGDVVVVGDGLGADEAFLEIGVDDAGRLRRFRPFLDRPGPRFLRADGKESDEVQEVVAGADDAVQARLASGRRPRDSPSARLPAARRFRFRSWRTRRRRPPPPLPPAPSLSSEKALPLSAEASSTLQT